MQTIQMSLDATKPTKFPTMSDSNPAVLLEES